MCGETYSSYKLVYVNKFSDRISITGVAITNWQQFKLSDLLTFLSRDLRRENRVKRQMIYISSHFFKNFLKLTWFKVFANQLFYIPDAKISIIKFLVKIINS